MSHSYDLTAVSSCIYSTFWHQRDFDACCTHCTSTTQITPVQTSPADDHHHVPDPCFILNELDDDCKPLREKNNRKNKSYKHVPHKDKPPSAVAKRNARERRRVQAVNKAFVRLRKAVPIDNARGKRISKVKTLQYAINYIYTLQEILEQDSSNQIVQPYFNKNCVYNDFEFMESF